MLEAKTSAQSALETAQKLQKDFNESTVEAEKHRTYVNDLIAEHMYRADEKYAGLKADLTMLIEADSRHGEAEHRICSVAALPKGSGGNKTCKPQLSWLPAGGSGPKFARMKL